MDSKQYKNLSGLEHKRFAIVMNNTVLKFKFPLYFKTIPFRGSDMNGSTLKHNDQTIKRVTKCQKQSLDYCDMINQSLEEAMERSTTVISSKSARSRSSTTLRNGYLKIGYQNCKKEEERSKYFNIA